MTEWRPAPGYEDKYEVSDDGQVRRCDGREVGQWAGWGGYMLVRFSGPRKMLRVHRLVAEAFVSNPDGLPFVNHIDHDRQNNIAANLEWCTQQQNLAHADKAGRMQRDYWQGKRSPNASLSDDQVRAIRGLYSSGGYSLAKLGERFGISKRATGRVVNRETYVDVSDAPDVSVGEKT